MFNQEEYTNVSLVDNKEIEEVEISEDGLSVIISTGEWSTTIYLSDLER